MLQRLVSRTTAGFVVLSLFASTSYASPGGPVTVDVYGSSYSVELEQEATERVLQNQPWWGNRELASELCEALVYQGEGAASIGFNTTAISGKSYIEAYLVIPLATCSGPVLVSPEDIGQMTSGTFVIVSGNVCLTNATDALNAQAGKPQSTQPIYQNISSLNCSYYNNPIFN